MKFKLDIITIETQPKKGFWLLLDKVLYQIVDINLYKKGCEVKIQHWLNKNKIHNTSIDVANINVAKFLAIYKDKTYSIVNSDYNSIVISLSERVNPEDKEKTLLDYYNMNIDVTYEGVFNKYQSKVSIKDMVTISSLYIIDQYKLYDKSLRVAEIISYDKTKHLYTLNLNKDGQSITCKRVDFETISGRNEFTMVSVVCPFCKK